MNFKKLAATLAMGVSATMMLAANPAKALDELTVAYFLEWPTPNQFAQANKIYEKELGVKVNWVSFDAGTAMSAAMASGDVHISFSQGVHHSSLQLLLVKTFKLSTLLYHTQTMTTVLFVQSLKSQKTMSLTLKASALPCRSVLLHILVS